MNILITGGAGFIGTHLYQHLKDKHNIKRIDNFKTSLKTKGVIPMDLSNLSREEISFIEDVLKETDVVFHFASSIGVDLIEKDPKGTLLNSFNINNNLFPLFEKYKPKVIYASSSEVYGSRDTPMKETDDLIIGSPQNSMRWGYATQKLMSEFLIKSYSFPYTIVRFFNVTGKGQRGDYGMVLPRFIQSSKKGGVLTVYGDGEQKRSFCDVRDAVNVLELLLTEMDGEILNIGNDQNITTIKELSTKIVITTGKGNVVLKPTERPVDIQNRVPNIDKMKTIYTPKYSIEDIIKSML